MITQHQGRLKLFRDELNKTTSNPILYPTNDSITIGILPFSEFSADNKSLNKRLQKLIRFRCLVTAMSLKEDEANLEDVLKTRDAEIRQSVRNDLECEISDSKNMKDEQAIAGFLQNSLLSAIAKAYDPHTEYFDAEAKSDFTSQLSSDGKSFGLLISENNNHDKIVGGLVPGGAAWRNSHIHINDKIRSVRLGNQVISDFRCLDPSELESMLDNGSENLMTVELEMNTGMKQMVTLRKELVRSEENIITGLILEKDTKKIGYISLPAFYTSSSYYTDKGCANDVGKEILKMKRDGIAGLIIDVRYNGGGDLDEAIDLAGLFIDVGPMGMMVDKSGKPAILKEMNRGVLFDGPLVIMVNGFSASASEVLAAVLQDYHRALVVGNSTYGKSTSQRIYPLGKSINEAGSGMPTAFVKATGSMLFRITGQTHQNTGVIPDISLTDLYGHLDIAESAYPNALKASFVDKPLMYKKFPEFPISDLKMGSETRQNSNEFMKALLFNKNKWNRTEYTLNLNPTRFETEIKGTEEFYTLRTELETKLVCPFESHAVSESLMLMDQYLKDIFEYQKESNKNDFQLHETFEIICDLIKLNQK